MLSMLNILKEMLINDMDHDWLRPVTVDDIELIEFYIAKAKYEESNHNVVNMVLWLDFFKLYQWHNDDIMIIICEFKDITYAYMPLCSKEHFIEGVSIIKKIFRDLDKRPVFNCYLKEYVEMIQHIDDDIEFSRYNDIDDYVYETEKLRTFSGKRLQKKRNSLNVFYREYLDVYKYETLTVDNIEDCRDYLDDWRDNLCDEFLSHEAVGIERVFNNWHRLPVSGGLIRINNCVRAFIVGSSLSDRMGQINIEKADESIRGLYQAILKEYLQENMLNKNYLNREDDMGKENLRQAKRSYHPSFMIEKHIGKGKI